MWIVGAIGSAISFGTGDFLGGVATRRAGSAITVVLGSHVAGLLLALVCVPLFPHAVTGEAITAGALAGLSGAVGLLLLFRGFAVGEMGLVAPVTAIGAAVVPVVYGLILGERPDALSIVGSVLALTSVVLVTGGSLTRTTAGLLEAIGSGIGFAVFFIVLRETDAATGLVPLVAARSASVVVLVAIAAILGRRVIPPGGSKALVVASGGFDMLANALFLFAARVGLLSIVAVLSSLYPVVTVVLAGTVLREHISTPRRLGLAGAVAGIALIAI